MNTFSYIFLELYIIASSLNIYFCYIEDEKKRKLSKPFCLLFLSLFALVTAFNSPLIYIGAFLALIGDLFMLKKKNNIFFVLGGFTFGASHFIFLSQGILLLKSAINLHYAYFLFGLGIYLLLTAIAFPFCKKYFKEVGVYAAFYLCFLLIEFVFGIFLMIYVAPIWCGLLYSLGYLFFFISDFLIFYCKKIKDIKRSHFFIMITYLIAVFLVVLSLIFPLIY